MNFNIEALERAVSATFDLVVGRRPAPLGEDGKPLMGPDGKPVEGEKVGFRVLGPNSDQYRAVMRSIELLNVKEAAEREKTSKDGVDISTDAGAAFLVDSEAARTRMIVDACTVGWFGFTIGEGDVPAEFNAENLGRVLKAWPRWSNRIAAAIRDEGNFTPG